MVVLYSLVTHFFKMAFKYVSLLVFLIFCTISFQKSNGNIIELDENNWKQMLTDEWMVEFYAPWCPACKGLQPVWREFASWSKDLGIKVAVVDVTISPGLSGRFMVTALPTIYHVKDGEFRQYKGTRDKDSFFSFIEDKKWTAVEPVSTWRSPNSFQMSIVSAFFKLSQILRQIHTHLMEEFGLPTWGSYLIFALATFVSGAVLGLILVCIIDFIYPPKYSSKGSDNKAKEKKTDKSSGDELPDEDIRDDLLDDASQSEGHITDSDPEERKSNPGSPNIKKRKPRKAD